MEAGRTQDAQLHAWAIQEGAGDLDKGARALASRFLRDASAEGTVVDALCGVFRHAKIDTEAARRRASTHVALARLEVESELYEASNGDGAPAQSDAAAIRPPRFRFRQLREVLNLPPVEFLVDNILPSGGCSVLAGFAGHCKSTVAIDFALSIAAGLPWAGDRTVRQGCVAYVAAEGWFGFGQRITAWLDYRNAADAEPVVYFLPSAPQLTERGDVAAVLRAVEELPTPPAAIFIDTLSRTFGGNENDGQDVGRYIAGVERIRQSTGAHVCVLHHTGWNQERERGHTALRAAVDTMMLVTKEDASVTLSCLKQKDADAFSEIHFDLKPWRNSVVLALRSPGERTSRPAVLPGTRQKALDALKAVDEGGGASFTKWCETSGLSKATFSRAVIDLVSWGLICKRGARYEAVQ